MWEAIRANRRRSAALIVGLAAVLILLGYLAGLAIEAYATGGTDGMGTGGIVGVLVALFVWIALFVTALSSGRRILLGSVGARRIEHDDYPVVFNVVEEMSIAAGLPKPPAVFIVDSDAPNAFAVGTPRKAAVAVTTGLLMRLNRDELQGVVAHEIGHVVNNDTRFMTLAGVMVAAIVIIADIFVRSMFYSGRGRRRSSGKRGGGPLILIAILFAVLAPILAQVLYFACSRKREFLADACSARFTRYPPGLASALEKIAGASGRMKGVSRAVAPMFTVNPLKGSAVQSLFSTHPPTEQRVRVLRSMGGGAAYADYEQAFNQVRGEGLIGARTLGQDKAVTAREPSGEPQKSGLEKAREAVDILHRQNGYLFLSCVCGLRTKVPPDYEQDQIRCPRCSRLVPIPRAAAVTAAAAAALGAAGEETAKPKPKPEREKPLVIRREPGQWQSFRCGCGRTVQLSPSFKADRVRCRACGRNIQVQRQAV